MDPVEPDINLLNKFYLMTEEMGRFSNTEDDVMRAKEMVALIAGKDVTTGTNGKFEPYAAMKDIKVPMELGKKFELNYQPVAANHMEVKRQFSSLFMERLKQIDRDMRGDVKLKLVTYQEWVEMLLQLNESIIQNLSCLENEVTERLTVLQRHTSTTSTCRYSQGNELAKARKDLATLTRIIQNAYYNNQWEELQQYQFETLTLAEVFGAAAVNPTELGPRISDVIEPPPPADVDFTQQHKKLLLNVKALAFEVAEKHDEVRELQKQIVSLEDEIQKAYLKIQLKDDVIKELRTELKNTNQKLYEYTNKKMHDMESMTESAGDLTADSVDTSCDSSDNSSTGTSNTAIQLTSQKNDDLMYQLKELASKTQMQNGRSVDICQRAEHEKREAYRKLDYLRSQLVDIETISHSADSGMCDANDTDGRIIDAIRRRICNLKECSQQLNKQVQQLSIENSQLSASLTQEKCIFQRVCTTLKEVADLTVSMTGYELDFNRLFDNQHMKNPFLEPLLAIKTMANTRETELLDKLNARNNLITTLQDEVLALQQNGKSDITELREKNTDLDGTVERLEKSLQEKQAALDKAEKLIRKLSTKKCKCLYSAVPAQPANTVTTSVPNEQINMQISRYESELANANKIIEDLRLELAKRNDMLAETCYKDTELEAYEVECNRLHKINQALTHEICRSSACRSALDRAKECMYAMHAELSRVHQHESQTIETLKKDCEQEIRHYRDRYNELSQELNSEREHKSQLMSVVRQLNKEQAETKHKNADLLAEIQKLRSLFEVQRKTYDNLLEKHNALAHNFELQSSSLHSCHKQIAQLQEKFFDLEKINKSDEVETRLLRDEVIYFKREISSLQTKLLTSDEREGKFINKIEKLHKIINEQDRKLQIAEASHKQIVDDLQRAKTDVSSRFDILSQQYQTLDQSYRYL